MSKPDLAEMAAALRAFLNACGLDPNHPDLGSTPERVARTWSQEFLSGYAADPKQILGQTVGGEADPELVIVGGLRFHAMCPHHLFPYRGVATVGYMPVSKLVGFGKLAQLVDCFSQRLTLQERITNQVVQALADHLGARGAGCVLRAEQLCLALPGEKHDQSHVLTAAFTGQMTERADLQARLYQESQDAPLPPDPASSA